MKKKTHKEFVQELKELTSEIEVIEEYKNSKEKIKFLCKKCNNIWMAQPNNILNGNKCPKCYGTPKKTHEKFLEEIKERNYKIEVLEKYIDAKTKIKYKCDICNNIWEATPNQILRGSGCPKCYGTPKKTHEDFVDELKIKKNYVEIIEKYIDANTFIKFKCKKCGNIWKDSPIKLLNRGLCPKCHQSLSTKETKKNYNIYYYGNESKTHDNFVKEMKKINSKIIIISTYKTRMQSIECKCKDCGYEWSTKAMYLLEGRGCPNCYLGYQSSFFEQCLYIALKNYYEKEDVLNRDKTAINKELDIYIPSKKIAIEYGSWFWHKDKLKKDIEKYILCKNKKIKLLTIYDHYNDKDISEKFENNIITFREDIGANRKNIDLLKKQLQTVFNKLNISFIFSDDYCEKIKNYSELAIRRKSTEEFKKELYKVNDKVEVIGEYTRLHNKIKTKCKKCNYIWETFPYNLLKKHGCPKCGKIYKKTTDEYKEELYKINKQIEVIGEYTGAREKISVKCKICGHEWSPAAGSLIVGHGCPRSRYDHKNI